MDPISALSIVANVFGVITFARDAFVIASQIHSSASGSSDSIANLSISARQLRSSTDLLLDQRDAVLASSKNIDQELQQFTDASIHISNQISDLVRKVQGRNGSSSSWYAVQVTMRSLWNKETMEKLEAQLTSTRAGLQLYVSVSVSGKLDRLSMTMQDAMGLLDQRGKSLLETMLRGFEDIKHQGDIIIENQFRTETVSQLRHQELLAAVERVSVTHDFVQPQEYGRTDGMKLSTQQDLPPETIHMIQTAILMSLKFPTIDDREEMIHQAHKNTFQWVYCDPVTCEKPWDDLRKFLAEQSGVYWVTGKAGSGKSTLMKYIFYGEKTEGLLNSWSGGKRLIKASFYFYYKGSELQKSEIGVLRSLLYQVLDQDRDMIRLVFEERFWKLSASANKRATFTPTTMELKRAFQKLLGLCRSAKTHLFLTVDGLDEYNASTAEMGLLVDTLKALSDVPWIKILVSSRPWNVFEEHFSGCPRLRLHDLTHPDILRFARDKLCEHPRFSGLLAKGNPEAKALMNDVVTASSGVFLWVYLVIRSLLEGLTNGDTIADLQTRLLELPTDLEDLFRHMWDNIDKRYRAQASRLIQLVEAGTFDGAKLSLLGLSLAESKDVGYALDAPIIMGAVQDQETLSTTLSRLNGYPGIPTCNHLKS
ncbi:hypothetical protein QBC41DRAFT_219102 [Cercophora samala]|uniref:NACHT domain-containing protein n=1 Tax=Cercophora samala TaxID=330535 RepID=A0AA39ZIK1_9PEZI|nr:hypothetical protein QBC41DRAFT_219102 [Cercophora samala]